MTHVTPPSTVDAPAPVLMSTGFWLVYCAGCGGSMTVANDGRPLPDRCLYCANGETPSEYFARLNTADQRQGWLNPTVTYGGAA